MFVTLFVCLFTVINYNYLCYSLKKGLKCFFLYVCVFLGSEWVQANETPVDKMSYRVRELQVGEKYLFRVKAVNIAGQSPPAEINQGVTIREITGKGAILQPRVSQCLILFCFYISLSLSLSLREPQDPSASSVKD